MKIEKGESVGSYVFQLFDLILKLKEFNLEENFGQRTGQSRTRLQFDDVNDITQKILFLGHK